MVYFRDVRSCLLTCYNSIMIDDTEFTLLYDLHRSKNPDIPHWSFEKFDLELLNEDVCKTECRFYRNDIYALADVLDLPDEIHCYNNVNINSIEGLCILLKRFSYPCNIQIWYLCLIDQYHNCQSPSIRLQT